MNKKDIPLFNIHSLIREERDVMISRFAPFLESHKNLRLPHKHSFYHILLFTEGKGFHDIDFSRFEVKPYQIYFMSPGQVHSWSFKDEVDGYVINFTDFFFQSYFLKKDYLDQFAFFQGEAIDCVLNIPEQYQKKVLDIFLDILAESENVNSFKPDMIRSLLLQLFINMDRLVGKGRPGTSLNRSLVIFNDFKRLVEKNYTDKKLPKDYADMLFITPNHLNSVCVEYGTSTGELIRKRITLEAKRLLVNLDLQISEIGFKLNFLDNSNFTKFFKKQEGVSPDEFRKTMLARP